MVGDQHPHRHPALVTPSKCVRWAGRDEVLLAGIDMERSQRWAEEYAETHPHPAAAGT